MNEQLTQAVKVAQDLSQTEAVKVARKGVDLADTAVQTVGRGVFWLKASTITFVIFIVLLIVDITVRILT